MSDPVALHKLQTLPQTVYLKNYEVPTHLIDSIHLKFDLFEGYAVVTSHMIVRANPSALETHTWLLNGEDLTLQSIRLNGVTLTPEQYTLNEKCLLLLNLPDQFELEIINTIFPEKNTALTGLYRSNKTYCTQCESEGFRHITYFPDRPDVLTRYTTTIMADAKNFPVLLSNGNLIESGSLDKGRHFATWEDPFKKACYLFALVAGDFDLIEGEFVTQSNRKVDLRVYVEKGYGDQAYHALYSLQTAMRWDENAFGREYDLEIYMIVAIGDFNKGAMENKGLNIFNTKYVLAKPETATDEDYIHILSVVGHEYFHNWSGNRVTCRDWFQLSLKEGLTIFRDQSFSGDMLSRGVMRIHDVTALRESQFTEDAGPLAHPVRPESYIEIDNFYTATVYNKGAEVLRMLQTILGVPLFRQGMDLYFERFDGQAVTIEDFVQTMEAVSGLDLKQFRRWYSQAGTPVVTVTSHYDEKLCTYTLTLTQTCPPTPGQAEKQPFYIPIKMGLLDESGKHLLLQLDDEVHEPEKVLHLTEPTQAFKFVNVPAKPIPSLLRHFSAPIKLFHDYSNAELLFLAKYDNDSFNRWEAWQLYILRVLLSLVKDIQQHKSLIAPEELISTFHALLSADKVDHYFLAEMLLLPSEKYIGEQMQVVDVDAIYTAREFVIQTIAEKLHNLFFNVYQAEQRLAQSDAFNMETIGSRQLKNRCLFYLLRLPAYADAGLKQFSHSLQKNMSDTMAALSGLANVAGQQRDEVLETFYTAWQHDALVVDKWLAVQAVSTLTTVERMNQLLQHPAFDLKNPNKVYALIGPFGQRNTVNFHQLTGAGYSFLREVVQQLDKLNPQVAARMVKPLTAWKRYDKERQNLMRKQLELLGQDKNLSPDLYELITKSL